VVGIQTTRFDVQSLRSGLRSMDDAELLRFGQAAMYMCSSYANSLAPLREEFVIQVEESRAEWRRRYPKMPSSESI
jgi:hypothetical protein